MDNQLGNLLRRWHTNYSERQKLQHTYLLIGVVSFIVAAIASLVNQHFGRAVLVVTLLAFGAFLANAIIWSLLYANILANIKTRSSRR